MSLRGGQGNSPQNSIAPFSYTRYYAAMELEGFIDDLMAEKGFDTEEPEVVAQIKSDLLESAERRINAMIMANLPPDDLSAFESVIDNGSEKELQAFVTERIPDLDQKVALELLNFRTAYIG